MPDVSLGLDDDWVFVALFRCAHCDRHVKLLEHAGDAPTRRTFHDVRICDACRGRLGR